VVYLKVGLFGLYFIEKQCDGDICSGNNDSDDNRYDLKFITDQLIISINKLHFNCTIQSIIMITISGYLLITKACF